MLDSIFGKLRYEIRARTTKDDKIKHEERKEREKELGLRNRRFLHEFRDCKQALEIYRNICFNPGITASTEYNFKYPHVNLKFYTMP